MCFNVGRLDVVINYCVFSGKQTRASAAVYFCLNRSTTFGWSLPGTKRLYINKLWLNC